MGQYGSSNIGNLYSPLLRIQRDFDWYYWWFNKTFLYRKAKKYKFLIQGEIESYHWSKEYCKLHPLFVYYLGPDGSLQHDSQCFGSDDNITQTFCIKFKQWLFIILKLITHNKKLIYFSDSWAGQYKNYKNFINLRSMNKHFAKCFISVNECLIRKAKTKQYSYFWLPNLHYFF